MKALETPVPSTLSWDIGHSRRFFYAMSALNRWHKLSNEISFPQESDLRKFANQIFIGTYNGDSNAPVFTNYLDGSNGWYLLGELEKKENGYRDRCGKKPWPPSSMSHYILLYYGNWIEFAPEHRDVYRSIVTAYLTNPQYKARYLSHCTVQGERSDKGCQTLFWPTYIFSLLGDVTPIDNNKNTILLGGGNQWELKTKYFNTVASTDEVLKDDIGAKIYRYISQTNTYSSTKSLENISIGEGFWYKATRDITIPVLSFNKADQVNINISGSRLKIVGNPFDAFISLDSVLVDGVSLYEQIEKQNILGVYFYDAKNRRYQPYINFKKYPSADTKQFLDYELLKTKKLMPGEGFWLLLRNNSFKEVLIKNPN